MMSRFRGLLPGVLIVVVLPLTLALIAIAIGATTLHQNEMRDLIATRDERAVREAANSLAERVGHQVQTMQAAAELVSVGVPLAEAQQRLGESAGSFEIISDSSGTPTSLAPVTTTSDGQVLIVGQSSDGQSVVRGTFTPQALDLPAFADNLRGSSDLHIMLLDQEARTFFHGDTAHMNFDPASVFAPGVAGSLRGESGSVFVTDPDRVEWVVAYAPVPQAGWSLIVAEPWEHVANPSLSTSLLTPLVLIPAVLIAVIVVIFGARRVIRPVAAIGGAGRARGAGRLRGVGAAHQRHQRDSNFAD